MTSDTPECLQQAHSSPCAGCIEASAANLPHSGSRYAPTYPGRLIHADIAGNFIPTLFGSFKWVLVLVDDHSRFKTVYFMKTKSEAPTHIRSFVAKFNSLLSQGKHEPVRVVGSLHSDNAGEFTSNEMRRGTTTRW